MCPMNFGHEGVMALLAKFSVDESTACVRYGVLKQTHVTTRLYIDQLWPEAYKNLTPLFPLGAVGSYSTAQCLRQLSRTGVLWTGGEALPHFLWRAGGLALLRGTCPCAALAWGLADGSRGVDLEVQRSLRTDPAGPV